MNVDSGKVQRVNPLLAIWWRQREALVYVWQHLLEEYIHRLYILTGLAFMLAVRLPDWYAVAPHPIGVMVQLLLFAPIGGLLAGYLFSGVLRMAGRWMGKVVPGPHTKAMVAWSQVPFLAAALAFVLVFLVMDRTQGPLHPGKIWVLQSPIGWVPLIAALPFYLWGIVVRIRSVQVLLGLPMGKAFLAWLISLLITYVPAGLMLTVYMILYYVTITSGGS